jgi:hypothetical protein
MRRYEASEYPRKEETPMTLHSRSTDKRGFYQSSLAQASVFREALRSAAAEGGAG